MSDKMITNASALADTLTDLDKQLDTSFLPPDLPPHLTFKAQNPFGVMDDVRGHGRADFENEDGTCAIVVRTDGHVSLSHRGDGSYAAVCVPFFARQLLREVNLYRSFYGMRTLI